MLRHIARPAIALIALGVLSACKGGGDAGNASNAASVDSIANDYVREYFKANPEAATIEGRADADHAALRPNSLADVQAWEAKEDAWLKRVHEIDAKTLDGTPAKLSYAFLQHLLESSVAARACRSELWSVSQTFTGWQSTLSYLFTVQPVGTDKARADAISRVRQVPRFLQQEVERLREGIKLGYTAPAGNVKLVIGQMDDLTRTKPRDTPFFDPARRDSTKGFGDSLSAAIVDSAMKGLVMYRDFLKNEYLSKARAAIGVSANPNGADCYKASVRYWASLEVPAQQVHEMGLAEMAKIDAEAKAIGQRLMGTDSVPKIYELARTDKKYLFTSRDEILKVTNDAIARAKAKMPEYFGVLPKADVIVQPVPKFEEPTAPMGAYNSPSDDGKRPGVYLINLAEPQTQSRAGLESTAFHETIPGHHLQIAIAKERPAAPDITRYFGTSGFAEGWGLYSERLAEEMGLFTGDIDKLGLTSSEGLRAARLVVDAGMHVLGWSRQQAIDYMLAHTAESVASATSEIDRYIMVPGQATSYMIGRLEIMKLREEAKTKMGAKFDIKKFHDVVLGDGGVTLALLRSNVEAWMAK